MYKVLIVEDEWLVREGLKHTIDWEDVGCRIMGEASDGETALRLMEEETPDIVLTDIRMPEMDGIQLAKEIASRYPGMKVVFLTGYDEFAYAQQAIKLGAADYVLKPTNRDELTQLMGRMASRLDEERRRRTERERLEHKLAFGQPLIVEKMLYDLMLDHAGAMEQELFLEYAAEQGEVLDTFRVALLYAETTPGESMPPGELYRSIAAWSSGLSSYPLVRMNDAKYALLLDRETERGELQRLLNVVRLSASQASQRQLVLGVSGRHNRLDQVPAAFQQATHALVTSFFWGGERLAWFEDTERLAAEVPALPGLAEELIEAVKWGTEASIRAKSHACFTWMVQQHPTNELEARKAFFGWIVSLYTLLLREDELRLIVQDSAILLTSLDRTVRLEDGLERLNGMLLEWSVRYQEQTKPQSRSGFEEIEDYIGRHYAEDITLQSIAERCNMSESYFSRLFKKQVGTSFVDYLTALRMRRAKELLTNPRLKIYEVGLQAGYQDSRYFSQIFRKYTGETPTEFRKRLGIPNVPI
ncbi:response regulator [Paenibacillus ehimensis]|uniref:response regulator n=1 Tax=Paenibacillus ehimensis TaxID=79264 RepID=UPI002DBD6291|nr:response regulator [Paenibacillus ehimensis]MEC0211313.1 response regulator [Paenibacillus ehimensis]